VDLDGLGVVNALGGHDGLDEERLGVLEVKVKEAERERDKTREKASRSSQYETQIEDA
jgi:hypothetical protein